MLSLNTVKVLGISMATLKELLIVFSKVAKYTFFVWTITLFPIFPEAINTRVPTAMVANAQNEI